MQVYSPWLKTWTSVVLANQKCLHEAPAATANHPEVRNHAILGPIFNSEIPESIPGFECADKEQMELLWPAGTEVALKV